MSELQPGVTEGAVPPVVDPENSPPAAVEGEGDANGRIRGPDGKFLPAAPEPPAVPKWVMPRIDQLTGQKRDLERALEQEKQARRELETRLATPPVVPGSPPAPPPPPAALSQADVERRAAELALAQRSAERFNDAAQEIVTKGRSEFKDFDQTLGNFAALGGLNSDAGRQMLQAAVETGQGHKVLHHLAQNLDEAQRVLGMSPTKMAIELDRMVRTAPPARSKAPEPIEPITGRVATATDELRDEDSLSDWIRKREAQVKRKK